MPSHACRPDCSSVSQSPQLATTAPVWTLRERPTDIIRTVLPRPPVSLLFSTGPWAIFIRDRIDIVGCRRARSICRHDGIFWSKG